MTSTPSPSLPYSAAQLSLVQALSGPHRGARLSSALVWPAANALVLCPDGITLDAIVTRPPPPTPELGRPQPPTPSQEEVYSALRWTIANRLKHSTNALIVDEVKDKISADGFTVDDTLWLRTVAQGKNAAGNVTLRINVSHHVAFHALMVALLNQGQKGLWSPLSKERYIVTLTDSNTLVRMKTQAAAKGKGKGKKRKTDDDDLRAPTDTDLIGLSFRETQFSGVPPNNVFEPTLPTLTGLGRGEWRVAVSGNNNPLAKDSTTTSVWPPGTRVYIRNEGRFVSRLVATSVPTPSAPRPFFAPPPTMAMPTTDTDEPLMMEADGLTLRGKRTGRFLTWDPKTWKGREPGQRIFSSAYE